MCRCLFVHACCLLTSAAVSPGALNTDMGGKRGKRVSQKPQTGKQVCGTCSRDPGDNPIGCDECEVWVHGTEMCSGLPSHLIDAILSYGGEGIKFICMKCRLNTSAPDQGDGSDPTDRSTQEHSHLISTIQQLFQQFQGMCNMIVNLSDELKHLAKAMQPTAAPNAEQPQGSMPPQPPSSQTPTASPALPTDQPALRSVVAEEVREMREREKRKQSIIIKGLNTGSVAEAIRMFKDLSSSKFGWEITLSDVTSIKDHTGMFRARIMSDEQRKLVLDKAKTLKGTQFDRVFISRDLTRAQRTVLYEKRLAKRTQNQVATNGNCPGPSASDPTQATPASLTNALQSTEPTPQITTDVSQGEGAAAAVSENSLRGN